MRTYSPKQIALLSSILITLIFIAAHSINLINPKPQLPWIIPVVVLVFFGTCYFIVFSFVENFIHNKIKLIYRAIHRLKTKKGDEDKLDMGVDVLSEVKDEVLNWARDKKKEIDELKNQEAFRREFIGNLAHELKTPIFSIQGYILTLLEGGLEDPNVNRDFLNRAARGVERMTRLIEDLDLVSKIESQKMDLSFEKFNLAELVEEVIDSLELKAKAKHIKLKLLQEKPILVYADRDKTEQVFINLIANSINYGKQNGKTEIRFFDLDENIMVEVADDGIGISKENLPRLFERFYRVDKSRSRNAGGTGLGLSIVKHIIEGHNQTLDVRSTEKVGSTFSFTLSKV